MFSPFLYLFRYLTVWYLTIITNNILFLFSYVKVLFIVHLIHFSKIFPNISKFSFHFLYIRAFPLNKKDTLCISTKYLLSRLFSVFFFFILLSK